MSNISSEVQEERLLATYLVNQVCNRASGRSESECVRNYPRDVYFLGNLRPRQDVGDEVTDDFTYMRELVSKMAPAAFGAEFLIHPSKNEVVINVTVQWACYYRIFPTCEQQRDHQKPERVENDNHIPTVQAQAKEASSHPQTTPTNIAIVEATDEPEEADTTGAEEEERREQAAEAESPEIAESTADRRARRRTPRDSLFIRFRKIDCQTKGQIILRGAAPGSKEIWTVNKDNLQVALDQETLRAQQQALQDPLHVRTAGRPEDRITIPEDAIASAETYNAYIASLRTEVIPEWKWEVRTTVRQSDPTNTTECVLLTEFVNATPILVKAPNTEPFLFDTSSTFAFDDCEVNPFELELAPKGFRYDKRLWGRGFNCAIKPDDQYRIFITTHTPIYEQQRYVTQTRPLARFDQLAQDPIPVLRAIVRAMEDYMQEWDRVKQTHMSTWPDWQTFEAEFERDQQQFADEIARFRRGCELIRTNSDVKLAFQLTNETFRRVGDHGQPEKRKEHWRLFQIVFLVSQIPGIAVLATLDAADLAEREMVDIIYFPTGGGKTEAYLGTIIFHCFFDRLRGKSAGVTAWTRFPLRLLTLQQTQRVADVIGMAEIIRREQTEPRLSGNSVDGFAVGYLVGDEATPNEIVDVTKYSYSENNPKDRAYWSKANDRQGRRSWKRVFRCPACRTQRVRIDFDAQTVRIIHRCEEPNCAFPDHIIPVYVVDNEIYRYLPSVLVGTIDKLASVGNQRKLAQVFGQIDGRCLEHGYYKKKCCQKECTGQRLKAGVPRGLSGPTLFVQDELHLLKEGLGTFDAHYETFIQRLRKEFDPTIPPLKIIASSATIEAFERQVAHLYGRDTTQSRVFPGLGPRSGQSFYAETLPYAQRLFIGLIPHNKTIFNTILELIEYYHREVQTLQRLAPGTPNPYGGSFRPGTVQWFDLLDYYVTSLTYFLANRELNSIRTDINGDTNPNLQRDGFVPLDVRELTGSTGTEEVTLILDHLEQRARQNIADAVLATNMVSHGVDVNRFNTMIFYGMPRQNAEYIQASSRVGRSHVGIVFMCLHPARERDQSHYTYFSKFHEFLGQLVEPVAINRWAKFSVKRTLPGLFMAVLLQLLANKSGEQNPGRFYMADFLRKKISENALSANDFLSFLEEAYIVPSDNPIGEQGFRDEIRWHVKIFMEQIIAGRGKFVSEVLIPKPMRSLRDVDEPIDIELDSAGSSWANKM